MKFESFSFEQGKQGAEFEKDKEKAEKDIKKRAEMWGLSKEEYKTLKGLGEELADAHIGHETRPSEEIWRDIGQHFIDSFKRQSSQKEQKQTEQVGEEKSKEEKSKEYIKSPEQEAIFEIKKRLKGYDVSVGIEKGQEPIKGKIDLTKKELKFRVTPEGISKGIEVAKKFLNDPLTIEKWTAFNNKWEKWLQEKRIKREKEKSSTTIKKYAEQEGKDETEIVKELLEEIEKENKQESK